VPTKSCSVRSNRLGGFSRRRFRRNEKATDYRLVRVEVKCDTDRDADWVSATARAMRGMRVFSSASVAVRHRNASMPFPA
jgi:hypothetical protein